MTKRTTLFRGVCILTLLIFISLISFSQGSFRVTGKVTYENGKPLSDVTVQIRGSKTATSTRADGSFEINAPSGKSTLVFGFVGYDDQELSLNNKTAVSMSMKPAAVTSMTDVVVIGYGTQKKRNVTGAVSKLRNEIFDERGILRVDQALVGQLAGVTVKQNTGIPGKAFSIQVRGSGSISGGNEPLYVLDGFPLALNSSNTVNGTFSTGNPLDNINPNDIESV